MHSDAPLKLLDERLRAALTAPARAWLDAALAETREGAHGTRFASLLSLVSRHVPDRPLAADADARADLRAAGHAALAGWSPERWTLREAARVLLLSARPDLAQESFARDLEEAFRYSDVGEACALYKALPLLPGPERFVWRAREGCRTNMLPVFESVACDNPFPTRHFDAVSFRQLVIKAVFVNASLWRLAGFDGRIDDELARMALDLVDERRSASRPVPPYLWACLGAHGGERGVASMQRELTSGAPAGRSAAALALARAGRTDLLRRAADSGGPEERDAARAALAGPTDSTAFRAFDERDA